MVTNRKCKLKKRAKCDFESHKIIKFIHKLESNCNDKSQTSTLYLWGLVTPAIYPNLLQYFNHCKRLR